MQDLPMSEDYYYEKAKFESKGYVDTFFDLTHAYNYLEKLKDKHPIEEWEIVEERINMLGGGYRAGIVFVRRQSEFDI